MSDITTAFWGMTINNYDETDLALVRQGYPDYIRQIVYTLEEGEQGTPHIQAYLKLYRQQRLSYVKKLFPRGNFKALTNDEYKLNAQRYAQKLDGTAQSPATITNNPFPDPVVELTDVIETVVKDYGDFRHHKEHDALWFIQQEERERVVKTPRLAKFYVSATYKNIKKEFWPCIVAHVLQKSEDTHTHTHTAEIFSHAEGITQDGLEEQDTEEHEVGDGETEGEDGEDYEDSESSEDEGHSEGRSVSGSSSDLGSQCREQGNRKPRGRFCFA